LKVILNSDVLINLSYAHGVLPDALHRLCQQCCNLGIAIVVPRTTLLEFNRRRDEHAQQTIRKIIAAYEQLDAFSIGHDTPIPEDLVTRPELLELIAATGVSAELTEPTIDDFNEAHSRACLHLPPRGEGKSDEMRDLVIRAMAIRVAQEEGGAVLIAGDKIFHNDISDEEAVTVGLTRVKTIEAAIAEIRAVRSPAVIAAAQFAEAIWADLSGAGLRLPSLPAPYDLTDIVFTMGEDGQPSNAYVRISCESEDGQLLQANLLMFMDSAR
jgi:hypothetical protein